MWKGRNPCKLYNQFRLQAQKNTGCGKNNQKHLWGWQLLDQGHPHLHVSSLTLRHWKIPFPEKALAPYIHKSVGSCHFAWHITICIEYLQLSFDNFIAKDTTNPHIQYCVNSKDPCKIPWEWLMHVVESWVLLSISQLGPSWGHCKRWWQWPLPLLLHLDNTPCDMTPASYTCSPIGLTLHL